MVKLYNILNGVFEMAFLDDSIPMNPMLKVKRPAARKDETSKEESEKALTAKELAYVLSCVENEPLKWRVYMNLAAEPVEANCAACGGLILTGEKALKPHDHDTPQSAIYSTSGGL